MKQSDLAVRAALSLIFVLQAACTPVAETSPRATATALVTTEPTRATDARFEWRTSSPAAQGLNETVLADYLAKVRSGAYGEVHSLLVVRHGVLVFEEYFDGYDRSKLHPVYSATKSVTSGLIGIALSQGKIRSVNDKLLSFFPDYVSASNPRVDKQEIKLEDVLTMRAGFDWDEGAFPYGDPRNPAMQMAASSDWIGFMLDRPMADPAGTRFRYNSGCSVLLGGVLRNATGMQAEEFAKKNLFEPLDIWDYRWEKGAQGLTNTGWGLHLLPRDMAKIGQLYLQNGTWNGKQIIPADWTRVSTTAHTPVRGDFSYGYQWWQMPLPQTSAKEIYFAWGWGGQYIFVVPLHDVVVVSTAADYEKELEAAINFVPEMLVQAAN